MTVVKRIPSLIMLKGCGLLISKDFITDCNEIETQNPYMTSITAIKIPIETAAITTHSILLSGKLTPII